MNKEICMVYSRVRHRLCNQRTTVTACVEYVTLHDCHDFAVAGYSRLLSKHTGKSKKTWRQLEERPVPRRYDAVLATTTNRVAVDDQFVPW